MSNSAISEAGASNTGKIGVVTVTYNSGTVLSAFLESMARQSYGNFLLYAVDNASKDDSVAQLEAWGDARLRVIANAENVGVAEGNNQGTIAALAEGCEYVLYLNNDVEFEAETFATLAAEIDSLGCDLLAPKIMFGDGVRIWAAGAAFNRVKGYLAYHIGEGETDRGQFENARRIEYSPTCCLLVRKTVFDSIGMMDPTYFVYWDDADFSFRAQRAGLTMYYTPKARILHKVSALTGGSTSAFTIRYNARGHIYFMLKNLGVLQCLGYLAAWELRLLYKLLSGSIDKGGFMIRQRAFFEGIRMWRSPAVATPTTNAGEDAGRKGSGKASRTAVKIKGERPRIGVDLHTLEGLYQGSRTHCYELFSRTVTRLPEIDFYFFVDTARWEPSCASAFTAPNARVVNMPHSNPFYRLGIQLPALTKEHRLDLLHTQYICPPLLQAKTAVTIHDILFEDFPQYFETFLRLRSRLLFRLSASTSEMIFTGSQYSKEKLEQTYKVPSAKLTTLWNGASEGRFFPGTEGADEVGKLGVSPGEYLLSVGRLEPRKNRLGLLRALALLPTPRPKLVIAGQRDFGYEKIFQLRDELLLQDDVIFLETASDDLLAALYRNARLFVYPSFAEGFGMPVIEAMASGIPVITSNTTSLPEVAGDAALLVDPHSPEEIRDAMNRVLHDEALAARMREAGIRRAEVFNWDGAADMLADKYRAYFTDKFKN